MEEFVYEVKDDVLRRDLQKVLNRKSPFANFKAEVDYSNERQNWFDFRDKKYVEYVRNRLEFEVVEIEQILCNLVKATFCKNITCTLFSELPFQS